MRRFNVFVLGVALGAALLWVCAFAGMLGFLSVEGAIFSALILLAIVAATLLLGGVLARFLLYGSGSSLRDGVRRVGPFVGGSLFVGAFASGVFVGVMILLNAASSDPALFLFAIGLGLVYGMVLGVPAVVGATLVEVRFRAREGEGP